LPILGICIAFSFTTWEHDQIEKLISGRINRVKEILNKVNGEKLIGRLWKFKMGPGGSWLELINTEVHPLEDSVEPVVQEDGLNLSLTKRSKIITENPRIGSPKVQILALEAQAP
jgi:hypothetical protein